MMLPHGPDFMGFEKASYMEIKPHKLDQTIAFMFEIRFPQQFTQFAADLETLQDGYLECWLVWSGNPTAHPALNEQSSMSG